ncbi:hypothetical protein BDQ12DRAFT_668411 [Crucibulum laeve]|uniref:Uncharacterized protein n=1 Tax=Crucibulum laeve TaxID=68775 RepID=A0A5C3LTW1_9AGAR|nr:hypothetical protein BDQ12DRAFT_668411 [Crucibulum laeve]
MYALKGHDSKGDSANDEGHYGGHSTNNKGSGVNDEEGHSTNSEDSGVNTEVVSALSQCSRQDNLRQHVGHIDSVIVHSSGGKTVLAPMEDVMINSPLKSTLIINRRFLNFEIDFGMSFMYSAPYLHVDTSYGSMVEQANKDAPAFSWIFKKMILITSREKSLPRSSKGMVMRKASLKMYEEEIEAL